MWVIKYIYMKVILKNAIGCKHNERQYSIEIEYKEKRRNNVSFDEQIQAREIAKTGEIGEIGIVIRVLYATFYNLKNI